MFPFPHRLHLRSCVLILGISVFASFSGAATQPDVSSSASDSAVKRSPGRLVCQPCRMDFGKVRVGQAKALPVTLKNVGHTAVTISSKSKHAAWVSPRGLVLPYTLLPGKTIRFHLVYSPLDSRKVSGRIAYRSNAANQLLPISVSGESTSGGTLIANPARLDFGSIPVGNSVSKTQTITNTGNANVSIEQITESGSGFSVGSVTTPQTLAPGHSVTFTVEYAPQKTGAETGSLITLSSATNYRLSVVESGTGTAGGSVSISPSSLAFGNVAVGSSKSKSVTLTASGTGMTIKSNSLSSSEYSISGLALPFKLGAGKSVTFQTTFTPQKPGTANANLALTVASPTSTLKEALSGTGTSASQHSVSLSWKSDASPVAGYNVYRSAKSAGPYVKLTSPVDPATDYVDTSVASGKTYYYEVTAVNNEGQESARSKPVGATVP